MYAGRDFSVSDGGYEVESYGFDFTQAAAAPTDHIVSAVFNLATVSGIDPAAAGRLQGAPVIRGQAVSVPVGLLLPGVKYRLQCVATFASGRQLSLFSFVLAEALPSS